MACVVAASAGGGVSCKKQPTPPDGLTSATPRASATLPLVAPSASSGSQGASPVALTHMRAVEPARLEADIRFIAKPRPPGSPHHRAVRERCAEVLKQAGFEVTRQAFPGGENVVGKKAGKTDRQVILSAHYDHIAHCSGADDNATGVAIVWEAARVLGRGRYENTLVLGCWDDEEAGLNGSAAWAARAKQQKADIALMIALDGVGFTNPEKGSQAMPPGFDRLFPAMGKRLVELEHRGTFIAVIADTSGEPGLLAIQRYAERAALPVLGDALGVLQRLALLDAARSDHASFWLQGYPALLVTDTANFRNPYYHCQYGDDAVDTLDLAFTARVGQTLVGAVADLLESRDTTSKSSTPGDSK